MSYHYRKGDYPLKQVDDGKIRALIDKANLACPDHKKPIVSVSLRQGDSVLISINADHSHKTASLMKVPVMGAAYQLADKGQLDIEERLTIVNDFTSIAGGGSRFSIDPCEDADSEIYSLIGQSMSIRDLIERMICISSNLATDIVFERVGRQAIQSFIEDANAAATSVPRAIEDMLALEQGQRNRTTAEDMTAILVAIWEGRMGTPESRMQMLGHLGRQTWNDELPSRLPSTVNVMHKTGWLSGVLHDAAIIEGQGIPTFSLAVLSSEWTDDHVAQRLLQEIGLTVYDLMIGR